MTLGTEVITSVVTRLSSILVDGARANAFEHLMELGQLIDVVVEFWVWLFDCRLNIDLNNVPRLVVDIDTTLTTIAGVVDHQSCPIAVGSHAVIGTVRDQMMNR